MTVVDASPIEGSLPKFIILIGSVGNEVSASSRKDGDHFWSFTVEGGERLDKMGNHSFCLACYVTMSAIDKAQNSTLKPCIDCK